MSLTDTEANLQLTAFMASLPDPFYVGLLTSTPNFDGSAVAEPPGAAAYARKSVAKSIWNAAAARAIVHNADIVFPTASATWGTLTHAAIFRTSAGADLVIFQPLNTPRTVNATDVFRFLAATSPLRITIPKT